MKRNSITRNHLCFVSMILSLGCSNPSDSTVAVKTKSPVEQVSTFGGDDEFGKWLNQWTTSNTRLPVLQDIEAAFKLGRQCNLPNTAQTFLTADSITRNTGGDLVYKNSVHPRFVMTKCTKDYIEASNLMVSIIHEKIKDVSGNEIYSDEKDLSLEIISWDPTEKRYSFYVSFPQENRIHRVDPGKEKDFSTSRISTLTLKENKWATMSSEEWQTRQGAEKFEGKCFHCHVNGAPIMADLAEPWNGWISARKEQIPESQLEGFSELEKVLTKLTSPTKDGMRGSFANEFEQVIRHSIERWAKAFTDEHINSLKTQSGNPLARSVFCDTQLNISTGVERIPTELYVDRDAEPTWFIPPPKIPINALSVPVRSEQDRAIVRQLVLRGELSRDQHRLIAQHYDQNGKSEICTLYETTGWEAAIKSLSQLAPNEGPKAMSVDAIKERLRNRWSYAQKLYGKSVVEEVTGGRRLVGPLGITPSALELQSLRLDDTPNDSRFSIEGMTAEEIQIPREPKLSDPPKEEELKTLYKWYQRRCQESFSSQGASVFVEGKLRWSIRDVAGVSGSQLGQEYTEYALHQNGKPVSMGKPPSHKENLECVFTRHFYDLKGSLKNTMRHEGNGRQDAVEIVLLPQQYQVRHKVSPAKFPTPSKIRKLVETYKRENEPVSQMVAYCAVLGAYGRIRLPKHVPLALAWRNSDSMILMKEDQAGAKCKYPNETLIGEALLSGEEIVPGVRGITGFHLTGWNGVLPSQCKFQGIDDGRVICSLGEYDKQVVAHSPRYEAEPHRFCRDSFATGIVAEVAWLESWFASMPQSQFRDTALSPVDDPKVKCGK